MKVLLPIDNSVASQNALASITRRAWSEQTEFLLIHVLEPVLPKSAGMVSTYSTEFGKIVAQRLAGAKALIDYQVNRLNRELGKNKCVVHGLVLEGPVVDCVIERAFEWQADMIVVASQNNLGKVAETLVTFSPCSVEIVKCA